MKHCEVIFIFNTSIFLHNSFKNEPRPKLYVNTQVLPIPYYTMFYLGCAPFCRIEYRGNTILLLLAKHYV